MRDEMPCARRDVIRSDLQSTSNGTFCLLTFEAGWRVAQLAARGGSTVLTTSTVTRQPPTVARVAYVSCDKKRTKAYRLVLSPTLHAYGAAVHGASRAVHGAACRGRWYITAPTPHVTRHDRAYTTGTGIRDRFRILYTVLTTVSVVLLPRATRHGRATRRSAPELGPHEHRPRSGCRLDSRLPCACQSPVLASPAPQRHVLPVFRHRVACLANIR